MSPPPQQQPPPQQPPPTPQQLAEATATVLATVSTVSLGLEMLAPLYVRARISKLALQSVLGVVMGMPPGETGFYGPATAHAVRMNTMRRAAFMLSAARRMQGAIERARSLRQPGLVLDQLQAERRFYGQHLTASWARENAASKIDSMSMIHGRLLGWYTVHTPTTTPECAQADQHNFLADREPPIGWPGMAHPGCRCYPGAPIPGAAMVGSPAVRRRVLATV